VVGARDFQGAIMAGRGPQSFKKRQKEQQRKEKQQEKLSRKLERKQNPGSLEDQPLDEPAFDDSYLDRPARNGSDHSA
jgi:hypothetical protein